MFLLIINDKEKSEAVRCCNGIENAYTQKQTKDSII